MLTDPPLEVHPRELQVLRGISYGLSNAAIGDRLHLSEHTVKTYLRRLFTNVGARDRTHAVRRGFELGLLAPQQTESRPPAIRITGNVEGLRPGTPRGPLSDQHIAACFAAEACWCRRGVLVPPRRWAPMTARVLAECAYQPFTWPDVVFVVGVVGVVAAVIVIVIWLVNR